MTAFAVPAQAGVADFRPGTGNLVEQAKGALMLRYGIPAPEALGVLTDWALEEGTSVGRIASTLLYAVCQGDPDAVAEESVLARRLLEHLRHEVGAGRR